MRESVKALARIAAVIVMLPFIISFRLKALFLGSNRALQGSSQSLAIIPGVLGQYLRRAFYTFTLAECHKTVVVEYGVLLSQTGARIGENAYIGPYCQIGLAHIERNVLLAPAVQIPSGARIHGTAQIDIPIREQRGDPQVVTIGEGSWIGGGTVVMASVGRNTIIGAGSVVTHPIPDLVVAGGIPAKVLKTRENSKPATPQEP
jgi:virginiamycin A acetyltransferase